MVLLRGAHPAAVRPLVETLLDGHAPGDPEAPRVRVCFSPHELLDVPVGARVVLVGAERAPEWLNIHRPVVWERELVILLWVEDDALEHLRRNAPDFLDWVSHRIEVPWFAPEEAVAELHLALTRVKWIAVAGPELVAVAAEGRLEIEAGWHYGDLKTLLDCGDVVVRGVDDDDQLWRLMLAHAEVRWRYRIVLAEPIVLPPTVELIDARIEDWEQSAGRLESRGVEHARLVAALGCRRSGSSHLPPVRWLAVDEAHMELLGRVARGQVDHSTVGLARDVRLGDVADLLELATWSDDQVTPERVERGLRGGFRDRGSLARYVMKVLFDELGSQPTVSTALEETGSIVATSLLGEEGRVLRAWDPTREPSFERYLRGVIRQEVVARQGVRP